MAEGEGLMADGMVDGQSINPSAIPQFVTILVPEVRPRRWWQTLLHNRWSEQLRPELKDRERVAVISSFEWPLER